MRTPIIPFLTSFMILLFAAFPVHAQASFLTQATETIDQEQIDSFADLMRKAAENGVQVIVVDTHGAPLSQPIANADAAADDGMSGLMKAQVSAVEFRERLVKRLKDLPSALDEVNFILKANSPTGELRAYVEALFWSLVLFAIGYIVEKQIYGKRFVLRYFELRTKDDPVGYTEKLPFLVSRFFLRAIGVLVSMAVAYVLGLTFFDALENSAMQFTVALINVVYAGCRIVTLLWRMVLAPYACQYRISQFSNKDASRLYHWLWFTAFVDICSVAFTLWINELGLTYDAFAFYTALLSTVVVLMNIALILVNRKAISRAIRNGLKPEEAGVLNVFVSSAWAPMAIAYLLFAWVDLSYRLVLDLPLSTPLVLGAYGIMLSIIVVYGIINYLIERFFQRTAIMEEINSTTEVEGHEVTTGEETENQARVHQPLNSFAGLCS